MTFFPEPLRPSEGRQEDELRVDPIEADKREKDSQDQREEEKRSVIYGAFLTIIQKLTDFFAKEEETLSGGGLTSDILELKQIAQLLMAADQSESGKFGAQFSDVWLRLLQGIQVLRHTRREGPVNEEKLKALMTEIENYPPREEHKLGFYLSKYAGESWLPVPFRDILKGLYSEHRVNQQNSTLAKWVECIDELLQS